MMNLVILLSTYNGEKFISDQLDSLLHQTYSNWICVIRDDGSTDTTMKVLTRYQNKHPEKFKILDNLNVNLKPCKSFLTLLNEAPLSQYYMFCDQDDIWNDNKIELTLKEMKTAEKVWGKTQPLLVHSDLEVVDENLKCIASSMKKLQKSNCSYKKINHLILQNNVTGCTVMINKELKNYIYDIPENAIMHDWWFCLIASSFGQISYIDKPLIKYRQHSNNSVGAKGVNLISLLKKLIRFNSSFIKYFTYIDKIISQADEFLSYYSPMLNQQDKDVLVTLKMLREKNPVIRFKLLSKYNIKYQNQTINLFFKPFLLFSKK
jgi:glycosyltransferase involved in cell wall biosynthesis